MIASVAEYVFKPGSGCGGYNAKITRQVRGLLDEYKMFT